MIEGIRNQGMQWHVIFGEFIDNAFDAGAKRVAIEFDRRIVISDDGVGCANPELFLELGKRRQHRKFQLGCYGVGMKEAAMSAADKMRVESTCGGVTRSIRCDWNKLAGQREWEVEDPEVIETGGLPGTTIRLDNVRNNKV